MVYESFLSESYPGSEDWVQIKSKFLFRIYNLTKNTDYLYICKEGQVAKVTEFIKSPTEAGLAARLLGIDNTNIPKSYPYAFGEEKWVWIREQKVFKALMLNPKHYAFYYLSDKGRLIASSVFPRRDGGYPIKMLFNYTVKGVEGRVKAVKLQFNIDIEMEFHEPDCEEENMKEESNVIVNSHSDKDNAGDNTNGQDESIEVGSN